MTDVDTYILDEAGQPIPEPDIFRWGQWFENANNRRVAATQVGGYRVSTVFLASDHAFGHGPPILWELMVFGEGLWDGYQERFTSRADAELGHARIVSMIERGEDPPD